MDNEGWDGSHIPSLQILNSGEPKGQFACVRKRALQMKWSMVYKWAETLFVCLTNFVLGQRSAWQVSWTSLLSASHNNRSLDSLPNQWLTLDDLVASTSESETAYKIQHALICNQTNVNVSFFFLIKKDKRNILFKLFFHLKIQIAKILYVSTWQLS